MVPKDVVQLGPGVEMEVMVDDVIQMVLVYFVAVEATFQYFLTACELSHGVQLTLVSIFLKQSPQQL